MNGKNHKIYFEIIFARFTKTAVPPNLVLVIMPHSITPTSSGGFQFIIFFLEPLGTVEPHISRCSDYPNTNLMKFMAFQCALYGISHQLH